MCKQCGNTFEVNKHYSGNYICEECKNKNSKKKTIRYISEETRQKLREAGKNQHKNRRN